MRNTNIYDILGVYGSKAENELESLKIDLGDFLLNVIETIRIFGYRKASFHNNTAEIAFAMTATEHGYRIKDLCIDGKDMLSDSYLRTVEGYNPDKLDNYSMVEAMLDWVKQNSDKSGYLFDMNNAINEDNKVTVNDYRLKLLASLPYSFEKAQATSEGPSNFVGEIKERLSFKIKSAEVAVQIDTVSPYYGRITKYMYRFIDEQDNVLTWWTIKEIENLEKVKSVAGTVKEHTVYQGVKQTNLTRCKVA